MNVISTLIYLDLLKKHCKAVKRSINLNILYDQVPIQGNPLSDARRKHDANSHANVIHACSHANLPKQRPLLGDEKEKTPRIAL